MKKYAKKLKDEYLRLDNLVRVDVMDDKGVDNKNIDNSEEKTNPYQLITNIVSEIDRNSNQLISNEKEIINENNYKNIREDFYQQLISEFNNKYDNDSCLKIIKYLISKANIEVDNSYKEYIAKL